MNIIRQKELSKILSEASNGQYFAYEFMDFLDIFQKVIPELLLEGNEVHLMGFGTFIPKYSKPKVIKSGLTKEEFSIPPGMTAKFTFSTAFQKEIKERYLKEQNASTSSTE